MVNFPKDQLAIFQTPMGKRFVYDSVCYCNRCGMCASVCPSYAQTRQEPFSPRGRNQAFRQILSGKVRLKKEQALVEQMLVSCALCGKCTQNCPGSIPTPQHMMELRRRAGVKLLPCMLFNLLRLRQTSPRVFLCIVKGGLLLRRMGLLAGLSWVPGFAWLKHVQEILPASNAHFTKIASVQHPTYIYLPSLETQFFMPQVMNRVYQLLGKKYMVAVWKDTPSGLFEYTYGDVRRARKWVRKLIMRHAHVGNGKIPLVTDSAEVYGFLKQAPELFDGYAKFEKKATHFAACVHFAAEFLDKTLPGKKFTGLTVQLADESVFPAVQVLQGQVQKILRSLFNKNFVQCGYKAGTIPSLGYGFVKHTHAPAYALSAVHGMAAHQTQTVFVLSGLAALELSLYMRKYYPSAQVRHIAELNG